MQKTTKTATSLIGIDARAALHPQAGKGHYTLEIIKAMVDSSKNVHFVFFTDQKPLFPDNKNPNIHQVILRGKSLLWQLNLYFYLRSHKVDFFLAPTSYIYPAIAPKTQKVALIIHDLITFLYPKDHPLFPTLVERLTLPRALKKASQIFCVSENTKKDLLQLFPFTKKKKIAIATPAVSDEFYPVSTRTLNLPENFILAVGTLPRKNVGVIIEALAILHGKNSKPNSLTKNLHLCVVGDFSALPKQFVPGHKIHSQIHFFGRATLPELRELYSRAKILVFPSLYEGFGMPPLEAMACSCPVITSNSSSLPEVVGDAAIKVDPTSPAQIATAIEKLLDPRIREEYQKKGLVYLKGFSWMTSAQRILTGIGFHG